MNIRKLSLASSFFASLFFMQTTQADENNIEVSPLQQVTSQELAAIYVISEICPALVSDQDKFNTGFEKLAKEYLPKQKKPVEVLKSITQTNDFKPILEEARNDAQNAGAEKNKAICEEIITYTPSN